METGQAQKEQAGGDAKLEERICAELRRFKFYEDVVSSKFPGEETDLRVGVIKQRIRIIALVFSSLHEMERFVVWQRLIEGKLWEHISVDAETGNSIPTCSQSSLYRHLHSALLKMSSFVRSHPEVFETAFCDSPTEHCNTRG